MVNFSPDQRTLRYPISRISALKKSAEGTEGNKKQMEYKKRKTLSSAVLEEAFPFSLESKAKEKNK